MRWSSRVGDLTKHLFVVGPHAPDCSLQRLTANLSGSNPYTTPVDVNAPVVRIDWGLTDVKSALNPDLSVRSPSFRRY